MTDHRHNGAVLQHLADALGRVGDVLLLEAVAWVALSRKRNSQNVPLNFHVSRRDLQIKNIGVYTRKLSISTKAN